MIRKNAGWISIGIGALLFIPLGDTVGLIKLPLSVVGFVMAIIALFSKQILKGILGLILNAAGVIMALLVGGLLLLLGMASGAAISGFEEADFVPPVSQVAQDSVQSAPSVSHNPITATENSRATFRITDGGMPSYKFDFGDAWKWERQKEKTEPVLFQGVQGIKIDDLRISDQYGAYFYSAEHKVPKDRDYGVLEHEALALNIIESLKTEMANFKIIARQHFYEPKTNTHIPAWAVSSDNGLGFAVVAAVPRPSLNEPDRLRKVELVVLEAPSMDIIKQNWDLYKDRVTSYAHFLNYSHSIIK